MKEWFLRLVPLPALGLSWAVLVLALLRDWDTMALVGVAINMLTIVMIFIAARSSEFQKAFLAGWTQAMIYCDANQIVTSTRRDRVVSSPCDKVTTGHHHRYATD